MHVSYLKCLLESLSIYTDLFCRVLVLVDMKSKVDADGDPDLDVDVRL